MAARKIRDHDDVALDCLEPLRGMVEYPDNVHAKIKTALSDAFDRGFKAAGGAMVPDGARDRVELSLDREQLNALADLAEHEIGWNEESHPQRFAALKQFLETVNIFRSKR
jgi:hypothetical protein